MKLSEKKYPRGSMEVIRSPKGDSEFMICIPLRLNKTSVRGQRAYRRTLKEAITTLEEILGPYRRSRR